MKTESRVFDFFESQEGWCGMFGEIDLYQEAKEESAISSEYKF